jgi:hypothetical protein
MKIEDVRNNVSELQQSTTGQILAAVQLVQQLLGDVEARLSFSHLHANIFEFHAPTAEHFLKDKMLIQSMCLYQNIGVLWGVPKGLQRDVVCLC